jgi:hypothetical protein
LVLVVNLNYKLLSMVSTWIQRSMWLAKCHVSATLANKVVTCIHFNKKIINILKINKQNLFIYLFSKSKGGGSHPLATLSQWGWRAARCGQRAIAKCISRWPPRGLGVAVWPPPVIRGGAWPPPNWQPPLCFLIFFFHFNFFFLKK